jgi:hypothetical protein
MRTRSPPPFRITLTGPDGRYELSYAPLDDWAGTIEVRIKSVAMSWHVVRYEEEDGQFSMSGMTVGSDEIWGDQFWFELWPHLAPARIDYFGDRVLWRSDYGPVVV